MLKHLKVKNRAIGFTLIEMMVVVAIMGIIAAVAIPAYTDHVRSGHRADAQAALVALAQHMERRYSENNSYCNSGTTNITTCGTDTTGDTGAPSLFSSTVPLDGGDAVYNLTIDSVTATSFTVKATRTAGGYMDGDECGNFSYSSTGQKTQDSNSSSDCNWP